MGITAISSAIAITPSIQTVSALVSSGVQVPPSLIQEARNNGGVNAFALSTYGSILQELETLLDNNPNDVNNAQSLAASVNGVNAYVDTSKLLTTPKGVIINAIT